MNTSANASEQEGGPNWETENWDQQDSVAGLDASRPYAGNHLDWDWNNSMILAQPSGGGSNDGDAHRNSPKSGSMASSLGAYTGILSSGFPSNFSHNHIRNFSSSGIRSFRGMDSTSITTSSGLHGALSASSIPGIPGLAPTSGGHGDVRSSFGQMQRRRQYFGVMDTDEKNQTNDFEVRREIEVCDNDGNGASIGLNLGVRTYFSTEDTAPRRHGKRHHAHYPGSQIPTCQAEGCKADLSTAKSYHRRHKVCELHSKSANVIAAGLTQRFCQQCSRFQLLSEFDECKRSCRKRLAHHNRRRRKPQPAVSTGGGSTSQSFAPKSDEHSSPSTDPKSMLLHLMQPVSPSSASLENSDYKTGSVGNNLQLRTTLELDSSHAVIPMSQTCSTHGPDAQGLLSTMSIAPPVPVMLQNAKGKLPIFSGHSQESPVYQQVLHGIGAPTGPNLSLASLGGVGFGSKGPRSSGQNYSGDDWLWPTGSRPNIGQSVSRPVMNLQQLTLEMNAIGLNHLSSSTSKVAAGQVYSSSDRNLVPGVLSRDISRSDWMIGDQVDSTEVGRSSLSIMSSRHLEGQQFALLESSTATRVGAHDGAQQGQAVEFLKQHGSEGLDGAAGGGHLMFPALQVLRQGSFRPSIYDPLHNIL